MKKEQKRTIEIDTISVLESLNYSFISLESHNSLSENGSKLHFDCQMQRMSRHVQ